MLKRDVPLGAIPRIRQGQGAESRGTMLQHEVQNGVVQLHSPRASERHPEKIRMQHKESDSSKRWSEELLLFRMPVNHRKDVPEESQSVAAPHPQSSPQQVQLLEGHI